MPSSIEAAEPPQVLASAMSSPVNAPDSAGREKIAVLVIHGMGQQKPYETLDHFARNLTGTLQESYQVNFQSKLRLRQHAEDPTAQQRDWTQAFVRLLPAGSSGQGQESQPSNCPGVVDVLEYYWAPIVTGKVSVKQSIYFLLRTTLSPLKYLEANLDAIDYAERQDSTKSSTQKTKAILSKRTLILWRELKRILMIYLPVVLLLALLYLVLAQPLVNALVHKDTQLANWFLLPGFGDGADWRHGLEAEVLLALALLISTARLALIYVALNYLRAGAGRANSASSFAWRKMIFWIALGLVAVGLLTGCAFVFAPIAINHFGPLGSIPYAQSLPSDGRLLFGSQVEEASQLSGVGRAVASAVDAGLQYLNLFFFLLPWINLRHFIELGALAALSQIVRAFLVGPIGDLAVYLGSSDLSQNFAARSQILKECTRTVLELHGHFPDLREVGGDEKYDRILIASHSLGTVIAYDVLGELITRCRASATVSVATLPGPLPIDHIGLERLRGLLTFGSPLNKIYYFFRSRTTAETTVLNRILYLLHSFRLVEPPPGGAIDGPPCDVFSQMVWANAFSHFDLISGSMFFYNADLNVPVVRGRLPWTAHTSYWDNPELYKLFSVLLP